MESKFWHKKFECMKKDKILEMQIPLVTVVLTTQEFMFSSQNLEV